VIYEETFDEVPNGEPSLAWRAEQARRGGDPGLAVRLAREGLAHGDDAALRVALALALLDLGELEDARHSLEGVIDGLAGDESARQHGHGHFGAGHGAMIPDTTLAAATAATLELVSSLDVELVGAIDEASFERAFEQAETQPELMLDADDVAERVLRDVPAEPRDELLPSADSPLATRTFADLLARQGHDSVAESLRSTLASRPYEAADAHSTPGGSSDPEAQIDARERVVGTLERWLENLRRTAA
jgi:hypothetical protein